MGYLLLLLVVLDKHLLMNYYGAKNAKKLKNRHDNDEVFLWRKKVLHRVTLLVLRSRSGFVNTVFSRGFEKDRNIKKREHA